MPTLGVRSVVDDDVKLPFVWGCSDCDTAFSVNVTMAGHPAELRRINEEFREHCKDKHPGLGILGEVEIPKEGPVQGAAQS
jgi:hypothetical protein